MIHKYFGIDPEEVWEVVQNLSELEAEVIRKLDTFKHKDNLISQLIQEYSYQPQIAAALKELLRS